MENNTNITVTAPSSSSKSHPMGRPMLKVHDFEAPAINGYLEDKDLLFEDAIADAVTYLSQLEKAKERVQARLDILRDAQSQGIFKHPRDFDRYELCLKYVKNVEAEKMKKEDSATSSSLHAPPAPSSTSTASRDSGSVSVLPALHSSTLSQASISKPVDEASVSALIYEIGVVWTPFFNVEDSLPCWGGKTYYTMHGWDLFKGEAYEKLYLHSSKTIQELEAALKYMNEKILAEKTEKAAECHRLLDTIESLWAPYFELRNDLSLWGTKVYTKNNLEIITEVSLNRFNENPIKTMLSLKAAVEYMDNVLTMHKELCSLLDKVEEVWPKFFDITTVTAIRVAWGPSYPIKLYRRNEFNMFKTEALGIARLGEETSTKIIKIVQQRYESMRACDV